MIKTVAWEKDRVVLIDQTKLPLEKTYVICEDYETVAGAIKTMIVRGAPAIGVAAAMGIALGALHIETSAYDEFKQQFEKICHVFSQTRPTAVNLFWAIDHMKGLLNAHGDKSVEEIKSLLKNEAVRMGEEDIEINRQMGAMGNELIPEGARILTHCNAGALATAGYGTALGVIRAPMKQEKA